MASHWKLGTFLFLVAGSIGLASPAQAQGFGSAGMASGRFNGSSQINGTEAFLIAAPFNTPGQVRLFQPTGSNQFVATAFFESSLAGSVFSGAPKPPNSAGNFGFAMAVGDFNGDGFKDLAMSAPYETVGGQQGAGAVNILFGQSASGPLGTNFQQQTVFLTRSNTYADILPNQPQAGDHFGFALAAGDFNGDGYDDLAVGAPDVTVNGNASAGAVFLFYSQPAQPTSSGANPPSVFSSNVEWTLIQGGGYGGGIGQPAAYAAFGYSLNAGNFNGDFSSGKSPSFPGTTGTSTQAPTGRGPSGRFDVRDLAVGVPFEDVNGVSSAGAVDVYYGPIGNTSGALSTVALSMPTPQSSSEFGISLAAADFNASCAGGPSICSAGSAGLYDDLAIGAPYATVANAQAAGAVYVFYGAPTTTGGLNEANNQFWTSYTAGGQTSTLGGNFGASLAAGLVINSSALNGGCQGQGCNPQDLIIGEPYRSTGAGAYSGIVYILAGQVPPNTTTLDQRYWLTSKNTPSPINGTAAYAYAGESLATGYNSIPANWDPTLRIEDILIGEPGINTVDMQYGGTGFFTTGSHRLFPWP
ncbi:MAG TPA: FG-GAP repeat protein [Polyangiaceae bacterium]